LLYKLIRYSKRNGRDNTLLHKLMRPFHSSCSTGTIYTTMCYPFHFSCWIRSIYTTMCYPFHFSCYTDQFIQQCVIFSISFPIPDQFMDNTLLYKLIRYSKRNGKDNTL
jgi:hypothetical protein